MDAKQGWQWFALGSAFFAGLTAILIKLGVTTINSNLATFLRTIVVLLAAALIITWRGEWKPIDQLSRRGALFLVLSGVATALSWLCYNRALQMAPASYVAPIDKLSVAFVIFLACLFLNEALTWKLILGGGLVIAGVIVLAWT